MRRTVESVRVTMKLRGEETPVRFIFDVAEEVSCPICKAQPGEWCEPKEKGKYLCTKRLEFYNEITTLGNRKPK